MTNNQTITEQQARLNAQKLWNTTPCGSLEGDVLDLDYFQRVMKSRYEVTDRWMARAIPFRAFQGKKMLEIGIGQGTDLANFAQHGAICHGIDITDEHLRRTEQNFKVRGLSVELKKCDATAIDYPDNFFDLVYSMGVIHHIPDKERVLQEVNRVLKPGGRFIGVVYRRLSAYHLVQKLLVEGILYGRLPTLGYRGLLSTIETGADGRAIKPYVKLYTKRTWTRACSEAGMTVLGTHVYHLDKSHFGPFRRFLTTSFANSRWLEGILGWYILVEAVKS